MRASARRSSAELVTGPRADACVPAEKLNSLLAMITLCELCRPHYPRIIQSALAESVRRCAALSVCCVCGCFAARFALRLRRQIAGRFCAALRVGVVLLKRECLPAMKQGAVRVHFSEQGFLFAQLAVRAAQQGSAEQTMRPGQRPVRREFVDMQGLIVRP